MKRVIFTLSLLLLLNGVFAQTSQTPENQANSQNSTKLSGYRISGIEYNITGKTKEAQLSRKVQPDTKRIFATQEELDSYLSDLSQQYINLRLFDSVNIQKTADKNTEQSSGVQNILITANLVDSKSFLLVPYPSYSTNDGFTLKLKLKDDNFLGTISPLEGDGKINFDSGDIKLGTGISYNLPFSAGPFDFSWNNDYAVLYRIGDDYPAFNLNTGLTAAVPFRHVSLVTNFMQSVVRGDDEHKLFDNNLFYKEWGEFSIPVTLQPAFMKVPVKIEPYTSVTYVWSTEAIHYENIDTELSSPVYGGGSRISFGRVNWIENFRNGFELKLDGNYSWDFNRSIAVPYISVNAKAFKAWEKFALSSNAAFFACKDTTRTIGIFLRGIPDTPEIVSKKLSDRVLYVPAAFIFNFDLPFHLCSFTPDADSKLHSFGFEVQLAPFIDIALTKNDITGRSFSPKDGWYSGGFEVLVYPFKWKSIVVRGSFGMDLGKYVISNITDSYDTSWRKDISGYEIYIGIGLSY